MKQLLFYISLCLSISGFSQLKNIKIIVPKELGYNYGDFVQFLPDDEHFVLCANALSVFNAETAEIIDEAELPFLAKNLSVNAAGDLIMVSANNELLFFSFKDRKLELVFKTTTAELIKGLPMGEYYGALPISGSFFTGKGNTVYVCVSAFTLLYDFDTKKVINTFSFPNTDYVIHAAPYAKKQEVILAKSTGTLTSLYRQSLTDLSKITLLLNDIAYPVKMKTRDSLVICSTTDNVFIQNLETDKITYEIMVPDKYNTWANADPSTRQYLRKPRSLATPDKINFKDDYIYDVEFYPGTTQIAVGTITGFTLLDLKTQKPVKKAPGFFMSMRFSRSGKRLITNGYFSYRSLRVYDPAKLQFISEHVPMGLAIYRTSISQNKRWMYTSGTSSAFIWDLSNFTKHAEIKDISGSDTSVVNGVYFLNDSEAVVNSGKKYPNYNLNIYNLARKKYTRVIKKNIVANLSGCVNGEYYYCDNTSLHIIDLKTLAEEKYDGLFTLAMSNMYSGINFTKHLVYVPIGSGYKIVNRKTKKVEYENTAWSVTSGLIMSEDNKFVYSMAQIKKKKSFNGYETEVPTNAFAKIDIAKKEIVKDFFESYMPYDTRLKNNGKTLAAWYVKYDITNYNDKKETVYSEFDTETGAVIKQKTLSTNTTIVAFHFTSDNGKYFALYEPYGKFFKVYDDNGDELMDLSELNFINAQCYFIEESARLIINSPSSSLTTFIDLKNKKIIGQLANAANDNFFMITSDLHYMGSKEFIKHIRFKSQSEIFSFEQFDAYLNQPHNVLRAFGCSDSALIHAYETAYLKRMKVLGLKPTSNINFSALPSMQYVKMKEEKQGWVNFSLSVNKGQSKLVKLDVYNNGTLVFSENIPPEKSSKYDKTFSLEASSGINRFEFIVKDEAGLESPHIARLFNNTNIVKPDLYLVVIASEKFQDKDFNLAYAVKDASDVANAMSNSKSFGKIQIKKLFNQSFAPDSVNALKDFFGKAGINDVVMVFFAGHGYLDTDFSYYFPTYYTDFSDPKINSVAYNSFEKLFKGMKPTRKLMFIDACFSGEVDEDDINVDSNPDKKTKKDSTRTVKLAGSSFAQSTAMEMSKAIFSDLRQNTGATIISSAGGTEAAFEGEKWNNGLFTHCLLEGMQKLKADNNHDQKITLSELQKYVGEEVNKLSDGKQTPTYRMENTVLDYELW